MTTHDFDDAVAALDHAKASADHRYCPAIGDILARVGDKWSMMVVMRLLDGALRFNALKREIGGISQQMLSRTLRALERDGLVERTVHATVPVQVDYALSPLGHSLAEPVRLLGAWAFAHRPVIEQARARYDAQE
nr:helix-turn-helix domain-containing protein [Novosphingobium sp. 9]